jgi:hypothetical protein
LCSDNSVSKLTLDRWFFLGISEGPLGPELTPIGCITMNYTRSDQISIIKSITLREGDSKTLDCPFCYGRKKFTISKIDGRTIWNCYRASCRIKGAYSTGRSLTAIQNNLNGTVKSTIKKTNQIPPILSDIDNNPDAVEYLKSVNSYDAYKQGLIRIQYYPARNRVLYFNNNNTGAVGRSLDGSNPKWMSFGNTEGGIQVGDSSTAVVVEDVASACSVSRVEGVCGYALLGTNITTPIKSRLRHFRCVIIILDKDASSKALRLGKSLQSHITVQVKLTKEDLKWLDVESISHLLGR